MTQPVLIGTSGWSYKHWQGPFYPKALPTDRWLQHYAQCLKSVEINSSFYHRPNPQTLADWYASVPDDFIFSAKASRYITHMKKLKEPEQGLTAFLHRISILGNKLGPLLFQLPPRWQCNVERLSSFLDGLSNEFRYAFEFRDPSWFCGQSYELLSRHEVALCIYDLNGFLSPKELTTDFTYVRLHGPETSYQGVYDTETLSDWSRTFSKWSGEGLRSFCYFDNDQAGYAVKNAQSLQAMQLSAFCQK